MAPTVQTSGRLKDTRLSAILIHLQRSRKTGALVLKRNDQERVIYVSDGDVIFATSAYSGDGLGQMLMKRGMLTLAQFEDASNEVRATRKRLGAVLAEKGFISPKNLFLQVTEQVKEIILSLFTWIDGEYRFEEGPLPSQEVITLKMSTGNLILNGIKRIDDWARLRKELPPLDSVLDLTTDPIILFQDIGLTDGEERLMSLIDGKRPVSALFAESPLNAFQTLKLIRFFLELGLAHQLGSEVEAERSQSKIENAARVLKGEPQVGAEPKPEPVQPEPAQPEPAVAAQAAFRSDNGREASQKEGTPKTAHTDGLAETRRSILEAFDRVPGQNHYMALGVAVTATRDEIKKAYFRLAKLYHPDRHLQPGMHDIREKLETLFQRITEAYDTLLMERKRKEYDSDLVSKKFSKKGKSEGQAETHADKFQKAQAALKQANLSGALFFIDEAIQLATDRANYHTMKAQILGQMQGRHKEAEIHFKRAIELDPSVVQNYNELGLLYKKAGLQQRARQQFEQALQWDSENALAKEEIGKLKV